MRKNIMLCSPLTNDSLKTLFEATETVYSQPKLDGVRAWVKWEAGFPYLISSQGNEIQSVPHIITDLIKLKDRYKNSDFNFDGELYAEDLKFEDIVSIVKRKVDNIHPQHKKIHYHVFDLKNKDIQIDRISTLYDLFKLHSFDLIYTHFVPSSLASINTWKQQLNDYMKDGYEGIILRHPKMYYECRRPWFILKYKPMKTDIYKINNVIEAVSKEGKPLNRLGAIVCIDDSGNTFHTSLGKTFSHAKLADLWSKRADLLSKYVKIEYQNLTAKRVPRFGRFTEVIDFPTQGETHV